MTRLPDHSWAPLLQVVPAFRQRPERDRRPHLLLDTGPVAYLPELER
ncbi:hypothetical protein [Streptomyces diastaticus]